MEITFRITGRNEAELEKAAKKVLTEFNDYNPHAWSWIITAEAIQEDAAAITGWDGKVVATRANASSMSGDEDSPTA